MDSGNYQEGNLRNIRRKIALATQEVGAIASILSVWRGL